MRILIFIIASLAPFSWVYSQSPSIALSQVRTLGELPAEGDDFARINFRYSPVSFTRSNSKVDLKVYPYETIKIFVTGECNLCPQNFRRKKKRAFRKSKRWTERKNHIVGSEEAKGLIQFKLSTLSGFSSSIIPVSEGVFQFKVPESDKGAFGRLVGYELLGLVQDDAKCEGGASENLPSYSNYSLIIDIDVRDRYNKFIVLLDENKDNLSVDFLKRVINPRLQERFAKTISEDIVTLLESNTKVGPRNKISILDYINKEIYSQNMAVHRVLGSVYKEEGDFKNCIISKQRYLEMFEQEYAERTDPFTNDEIITLAQSYFELAECYLEVDNGVTESDLNSAFNFFEKAAGLFCSADNDSRYIESVLRQINILKKINDQSSLEQALHLINQIISQSGKSLKPCQSSIQP